MPATHNSSDAATNNPSFDGAAVSLLFTHTVEGMALLAFD